jgi:hypothetical protein
MGTRYAFAFTTLGQIPKVLTTFTYRRDDWLQKGSFLEFKNSFGFGHSPLAYGHKLGAVQRIGVECRSPCRREGGLL